MKRMMRRDDLPVYGTRLPYELGLGSDELNLVILVKVDFDRIVALKFCEARQMNAGWPD